MYTEGLAAGIAQSVQRLATGWTVRWSNPGGGRRFSAPVLTGSQTHPVSYTMRTWSVQRVKWPGLGADHPLHLAPRLKKEQSYNSIPTLQEKMVMPGNFWLQCQFGNRESTEYKSNFALYVVYIAFNWKSGIKLDNQSWSCIFSKLVRIFFNLGMGWNWVSLYCMHY